MTTVKIWGVVHLLSHAPSCRGDSFTKQ